MGVRVRVPPPVPAPVVQPVEYGFRNAEIPDRRRAGAPQIFTLIFTVVEISRLAVAKRP